MSANARLLKWPVFTCPSLAHFARPLTHRKEPVGLFSLDDRPHLKLVVSFRQACMNRGEVSFDAIAAMLPQKFKRDDWARIRDLLHALHALDPNRARPLIERAANDPAFANVRDFLVPK